MRCVGALVLLLVLVLLLELELGLFDAVSAEAPKAQGTASAALSRNNNVILAIGFPLCPSHCHGLPNVASTKGPKCGWLEATASARWMRLHIDASLGSDEKRSLGLRGIGQCIRGCARRRPERYHCTLLLQCSRSAKHANA